MIPTHYFLKDLDQNWVCSGCSHENITLKKNGRACCTAKSCNWLYCSMCRSPAHLLGNAYRVVVVCEVKQQFKRTWRVLRSNLQKKALKYNDVPPRVERSSLDYIQDVRRAPAGLEHNALMWTVHLLQAIVTHMYRQCIYQFCCVRIKTRKNMLLTWLLHVPPWVKQ